MADLYSKVPPRGALRNFAKRATDIIYGLGGLALTLLLPPFPALLIKCDSKGPILCRQRRVGLEGRVFDIDKFRSMRQDAKSDGRVMVTNGSPNSGLSYAEPGRTSDLSSSIFSKGI